MARVLYSGVNEHGQPSEVMLGCAIGDIIPHFGTTPPAGTLVCDGSEVSREVYHELFEEIARSSDRRREYHVRLARPARAVDDGRGRGARGGGRGCGRAAGHYGIFKRYKHINSRYRRCRKSRSIVGCYR